MKSPGIAPKLQRSRPDVQDHIELCSYLEAYYRWRKTCDSSFSYTSWAKELGLQSRVFLKLMVAGKRSVTEKSLPLFVQGLGLQGSEAAHFSALARLQRASTGGERALYLNELCRNRKPRSRPQPVLDHYRFLSSVLGPRVQTLLTVEREGGWSASEIAKLLGKKSSEIQEVLETLEALCLARQETKAGKKGWYANQSEFDVPDQYGSLALQSFHRQSLEDAIQAIAADPDSRKYQSMFVLLTREEMLKLHERTQAFVADCIQQFSGVKPAGTRLYQVNFNLIPVSEPILQAEKSPAAPVGSYSQAVPVQEQVARMPESSAAFCPQEKSL